MLIIKNKPLPQVGHTSEVLFASGIEYHEAAEPIMVFGHYLPIYPSEAASFYKDVQSVAKARKREKELREKFALKFNDAKKTKDASYLYLSSLQCLITGMLEANKRRPYRRRLSLRQIILGAQEFKVLIKLDEPVHVYRKHKTSGSGFRTICDFGPVARGAQRVVLALLREAYKPAPFQFTSRGVQAAIKEALRLITEEGYTRVTEIDIKSHYPSFQEDKLLNALPIPNGAIREIILSNSAIWKPHGILPYEINTFLHQTQLGIPQGSAASAVVAEWSVSQLKMIKVENVALICYADNMFLFAKSATTLKFALEALRSAIAGLPGGSFTTHPPNGDNSNIGTVQNGFRMLGSWISKSGETVQVDPTEASLQELLGRFRLEAEGVVALLAANDEPGCTDYRIEGVGAYLRLKSYVRSWLAAHSFCTDLATVRADMEWRLGKLEAAFQITEGEMKNAWDQSMDAKYHPASNWMKT